MAKNIKWIQVDNDTQVSIAISTSSKPAHPNLSGLVENDAGFDFGDFYYGTCNDSVTINSASNDNFIFQLSDAEYIADIVAHTNIFVERWKEDVYTQENNIRSYELKPYDDTAYAAGAGYKYDAAIAFINNGTANAGLTTEANARGISVTALANKIKTNHEAFVTKDAKISGVRGLLYDRICSIGVNTTSVSTALASYAGIHTNEIIGTATTSEVSFYQPDSMESRLRIL